MQNKVQSPVPTEAQPMRGDTGNPSVAGGDRVQRLLSLRTKIADIAGADPEADQEPEPELELHPLYRNAMFD